MAVFRLLCTLYLLATEAGALYIQHGDTNFNGITGSPWYTFFIFNTNWSYTLLAIWFGMATVQSFRLVFKDDLYSTDSKIGCWEYFLWGFYTLVWTAAWTVTLLYWIFVVGAGCALSNDGCNFTFYSFHGHGVNILLITIEMMLNVMPFFPKHVVFSAGYIIVYEIFSIIWWGATDHWVYDAQNPDKAALGLFMAITFYPVFILVYIGLFFAGYGIEIAMTKCCKTKGKYRKAYKDDGPHEDHVPMDQI